jgi:hypothetical protein
MRSKKLNDSPRSSKCQNENEETFAHQSVKMKMKELLQKWLEKV